VQTDAIFRFGTGEIAHELNFGVRYHEDEASRFQQEEVFTQEANGTISDREIGEPGGAGNRAEKTEAVAIFLRDTIDFGKLALIPGAL